MNLAMQRHMQVYARKMLDDNNLRNWGFKFNTNKRRRGVCKYNTKMIEVSVFVTQEGEEEVKKVIAHEVAHAIVGFHHGHDGIWRSKAIELGDDGKRCGETMQVEGKYIAVCPGCLKQFKRFRMSRNRSSCTNCSGGRFNEKYLLEWRTNA